MNNDESFVFRAVKLFDFRKRAEFRGIDINHVFNLLLSIKI